MYRSDARLVNDVARFFFFDDCRPFLYDIFRMLDVSKTAWDFSPLFAGDADEALALRRKDVEERVRAFAAAWRSREDYTSDPGVLFEALTQYERLMREVGVDGGICYYFSLRSVQDSGDASVRAKSNEADEWSTKLSNELTFFSLRIATIPNERRELFLSDARLLPYRHYLEREFAFADHVLSEPEENILNLKSAVSHGAWVEMLSRLLSAEEREALLEDGRRELVPYSVLTMLMVSKDKAVRDVAGAQFHNIMAKLADVAESEINAILADKKINDELRHYARPDSGRLLGDDIEAPVVDALLSAVEARFDISRRYYALKAKLLGQTRLAYHERSVEYGTIDRRYTYEEASTLVHRVLSRLDSEFGTIFADFVSHGQLDVYPKKGKEGGAFCAHTLLTLPTYIMLNFTGKLSDVRTLAHEVGHGINNELMRKKVNALSFGTPMCTAEVASTFMEDFVLAELRDGADEELQLALLMTQLNDEISSIQRQVACYRFEQELHTTFRTKGYLSKQEIGAMFQKHMAAYMGEAVEQSPGAENWWVYWSHIRQFFYVYSYASGLLISKAMQRKVREDAGFVADVKEFLAAGTTDSPKHLFAKMGISIADPAFWESGLSEISRTLDVAEALAKKLGKIA